MREESSAAASINKLIMPVAIGGRSDDFMHELRPADGFAAHKLGCRSFTVNRVFWEAATGQDDFWGLGHGLTRAWLIWEQLAC